MRYLVFLLISGLGCFSVLQAQTADALWVQRASSTDDDFARSIAFDGRLNLIITGHYEAAIDLGDQNLRSNAGGRDFFLAKYTGNGALIWGVTGGGSGREDGFGVDVDIDDNIYATGIFQESATISGVTLQSRTSDNNQDFFLASYTPDGDLRWIVQSDSASSDMTIFPLDIAAAENGDTYVTGLFWRTVKFGNTVLTSPPGNDGDVFLLKTNENGKFLWARQAGGARNDNGLAVTLDFDNENATVSGWFENDIDFGSGQSFVRDASYDWFVAQYTDTGSLRWVRTFGGPSEDKAAGVVTDFNDNIYVAGHFEGEAEFGTGTLTSAGDRDAFIAKFDEDGKPLWTMQAGSFGQSMAISPRVDDANDLFVSGFFNGITRFGDSTFTTRGEEDIFLTQINENTGGIIWAAQAGGSGRDQAWGLAVEASSNTAAMTGFFSKTALFGTRSLTSQGGSDVFLTRYGTIPMPDSIVVRAVNTNRIDIFWRYAFDDALFFRLYRKCGDGEFEIIDDNIRPNVRAYSDTTVVPDNPYTYFVEVQTDKGSAQSATGSASTLPPPTDLLAAPLSSSVVTFSWKDNSTIENGYVVLRGTSLQGEFALVDTVKNAPGTEGERLVRTFVDAGLDPETTYFYQVFAYRGGSASLVVTSDSVVTLPGTRPRLNPVAVHEPVPGGLVEIRIEAGDASQPAGDIADIGFELDLDPPGTLIVPEPVEEYVRAGPVVGSALLQSYDVDNAAGRFTARLQRTGAAGENAGTVLSVFLQVDQGVAPGSRLIIRINDTIDARDGVGAPVAFDPGSATLTIEDGVMVWPGDADDDGVADQADVLQVGRYFGQSGTARAGGSIDWSAQRASAWAEPMAALADGDGNGLVDEGDLGAIGGNFLRTHVALPPEIQQPPVTGARLALEIAGTPLPGAEFTVIARAFSVDSLLGVAYVLRYSPNDYLRTSGIMPGVWLGADLLSLARTDSAAGTVRVGFSRKADQEGANGEGEVTRFQMRMDAAAPMGSTTELMLEDVVAMDVRGRPLYLEPVGLNVTTDIFDDRPAAVPTALRLHPNYPNPFNPETRIAFDLPAALDLQLDIVALDGRLIRTLREGRMPAGRHSVIWRGTNSAGQPASSGVYLYRLRAGDQLRTGKLVLVR